MATGKHHRRIEDLAAYLAAERTVELSQSRRDRLQGKVSRVRYIFHGLADT